MKGNIWAQIQFKWGRGKILACRLKFPSPRHLKVCAASSTVCQSSMLASQALPFHHYTIFYALLWLQSSLCDHNHHWGGEGAVAGWPLWGAGKVLLISLSRPWLQPTQSAHPDWKGVTYAPWETALMAKPKLKLVSQPDEKLLLCFPSSFEAGGAAWAGRKSGGLILVGVTLNMDERANTGQKVNARSSLGKKEGQKRDGSPWGNRGKN